MIYCTARPAPRQHRAKYPTQWRALQNAWCWEYAMASGFPLQHLQTVTLEVAQNLCWSGKDTNGAMLLMISARTH